MIWIYITHEDRYSKLPMFFDKYKYDYKRRNGSHINMDVEMYKYFKHKAIAPALTLQELREDILLRFKPFTTWNIEVLKKAVWDYTAPELADWVIARLEAQP